MKSFRDGILDLIEAHPTAPEVIVAVLLLMIASLGFGALETLFGVETQISLGIFVVMMITSVVSRNWQAKSAIVIIVLVGVLCIIFVGEPHLERFLVGWVLLTFIGLDGAFLIRRPFNFF